MPKILIHCPLLNKGVATGLSTESIKLDSLDDTLTFILNCPACKKIHRWKRKDAWIEKNGSNGRAAQ